MEVEELNLQESSWLYLVAELKLQVEKLEYTVGEVETWLGEPTTIITIFPFSLSLSLKSTYK